MFAPLRIIAGEFETTMTPQQNSLPKWILIVSGIIALMEIMVSGLLCFSPEEVVHNADLSAGGVYYLIYMWAARQFALGVIFAYATLKRSISMLTICYLFFFVMMVADLFVGISQKDDALVVGSSVFAVASVAMLWVISKLRLR